MSYKMKIRTNILFHFLFVILFLALSLIGSQYYFSEKLARKAIHNTFYQTAEKIAISIKDKDNLSKEILYQIETHPSLGEKIDEKRASEILKHFIPTLKRYEDMYAVYLGYENGDLFEVINMHINKSVHKHYGAPKMSRWGIIKISDTDAGRKRYITFFDDKLKVLLEKEAPSDYYVTNRSWYQEALSSKEAVRSDAYLFSNLKEKGITYSKKLANNKTVLALDFTIGNLDKMLQKLRFSQTNQIYLYGRDGKIISTSGVQKNEINTLLKQMLKENEISTIKKVHTNITQAFLTMMPLTQEMGKKTYVGISVGTAEMLAPYREKIYYALIIALIVFLMFIPLTLYFSNHIVTHMKALMVENEKIKKREFDKVIPVETNIIEFIELSNSQLSLSKSIQEYQRQQEALLDAFIMLIADAIDAKSAYTGAHCQKVPIIASMLAQEAAKSKEGSLEDFHFKNNGAKEAFKRAAWLHDCGKITTPEYVVDKATKLETIYNRIHEVRTRFEVLWRDIEIGYYERLVAGEDKKTLLLWKSKEEQSLLDDFAFIATCNLGEEYMEEDKIVRLQNIAKRTWLRHFDNRLGLSEDELSRYDADTTILPTHELLLQDGNEHLIERIGFDKKAYDEKGFKMEVPKYLYNRGELYNLSIQKGTLTEEERFKINEHIIMTIKMLEQLPFPEEMKHIPQIAGEHHEKMDGTGYPRRLGRESLSIPSRIMAIADIFEALTASDRPYKKAKTLSETLKIMYFMKKEAHIDAELFDLFVSSGIYLEYAKQYLHVSQIDDVDISSLMG